MNFGKKYRKKEEKYHKDSKRYGTSGELIFLFFESAIPLLSIWGAFELPWEGGWALLKIFCFVGMALIFQTPTDLMITGIVALRHRFRMKMQNKIEKVALEKSYELVDGEISAEEKEKIENHKAKGTAYRYDLAVGIIGITLSVLVVVAFVVLLGVFISNKINALQ